MNSWCTLLLTELMIINILAEIRLHSFAFPLRHTSFKVIKFIHCEALFTLIRTDNKPDLEY